MKILVTLLILLASTIVVAAQTNHIILRTPPALRPGQSFTITVTPEPGFRVVSVILVVEKLPHQAPPAKELQKPEPLPRLKSIPHLTSWETEAPRLGKIEWGFDSTERVFHKQTRELSGAPGLVAFIGKKF